MENNFKCNNCNKEFYEHKYCQVKNTYYYKYGSKKVKCPDCGSNMIEFIRKIDKFETLNIGKYTSKSIPERQKMLKKRSHNHFKKHIEENFHNINRNTNLQS